MVIFIALSSILSKPGKSGGSVKRDISEGEYTAGLHTILFSAVNALGF